VSLNLRIEGVTKIRESIDMGDFSIDEIIEDIGFDVAAFPVRKRTPDETEAIIVAVKC